MTTYRRLWFVVVVVLAGLGSLEALLVVAPIALWAVATTAALTSGLLRLMSFLRRNAPSGYAPGVVRAAGAGAVVGVVVTGLASLLGGATTPLLLAVVCLHPRVLRAAGLRTWRWLHGDVPAPTTSERPDPRTAPAPPRTASPVTAPRFKAGTGASTRPRDWAAKIIPRTPPAEAGWPDAEGLRLLDTSQLCWGWRTSFTALQRTDPRLERARFTTLVGVRQRYLDEIARRDPAGFARWLYSGARPASDPSRYLVTPDPPSSSRPSADALSLDADARPDLEGPHA